MHFKNEQHEACPRKYLVSLIKHVLNKYSSLLCESLFALKPHAIQGGNFRLSFGFPSPAQSKRDLLQVLLQETSETRFWDRENRNTYRIKRSIPPIATVLFLALVSEVLLHDPYKTLGRIPRPSTFLYGQDLLILSLKVKTTPTM